MGRLTQMKPDCLSLGLCDGVPGASVMILYLQCVTQRCDVTRDKITGRIIPNREKSSNTWR